MAGALGLYADEAYSVHVHSYFSCSYSGFLVRFYWLVLIVTAAIGAACIAVSVTVKDLPSLDDPTKVKNRKQRRKAARQCGCDAPPPMNPTEGISKCTHMKAYLPCGTQGRNLECKIPQHSSLASVLTLHPFSNWRSRRQWSE